MNRRIFVIQVFSGLVYQTVQTFLVAGIRRREDGKKTITNDGGSYGFGRWRQGSPEQALSVVWDL
ncbi:hypothetical protein G4313_06710 [Coprococcus eutactus]|nr:hypothetical protein [Coprococcus eutactus]RHV80534.1 hypothetical protein DXB01_05155 [Clostridium sp. OF10-22XD]